MVGKPDRRAYWASQPPDRIREIAIEIFGEINAAFSNGTEVRFGSRGSKSVVLEGEDAGAWYDHELSEGGLLRIPDADFGGDCTETPATFSLGKRPLSTDQIDKRKAARRLWTEAVPIADTDAALYLEKRGLIACLDLDALRYHRASRALLVAVRSLLEGVQGVQRITLADPVTDKSVSKKGLGPIGRGEIVFEDGDFNPAKPTHKTLICEGVEDALSIWQAVQDCATDPDLRVRVIPMLGQRWRALAERHGGAIMVADADSVDAARKGAEIASGRLFDPSPFKDVNDLLRAEGSRALFEAIGKAQPARPETDAKPIFVPLADSVKSYTAPDYLIDGIVQRGKLYSFTAPTGHGKTAVISRMAEAIALGEQFCGVGVEKGAVVYFSGEDDVTPRFIAACSIGNLDPASLPVHLVKGTLLIADHLDVARRYAGTIKGGIALVIVDTLQAYFSGDDDNSNTQMLEAARILRRLTELPGSPAVIVPAHPVKNVTRDNLVPRGGSALLNEVDGNLSLWTMDNVSRLHWHGKFRGPHFDPLTFEIETVLCNELRDSKGRLIPMPLAKPVLGTRKTDLVSDTEKNEDAALRAIDANNTISETDLAEQIGCSRSTAHAIKKRLLSRKWIKQKARGFVLTGDGKEVLK